MAAALFCPRLRGGCALTQQFVSPRRVLLEQLEEDTVLNNVSTQLVSHDPLLHAGTAPSVMVLWPSVPVLSHRIRAHAAGVLGKSVVIIS